MRKTSRRCFEAAILMALVVLLCARTSPAEEPRPKGPLVPLRIQNACGGRAPGQSAPAQQDDDVGRVFIHSVLRESGWSPVLVKLDCRYHWTDGAPGLPDWLQLRDRSYRPGTWSCKFNASLVHKDIASLPTVALDVNELNQPGLEGWQGWFNITLSARQFSISSANKGGLGIDVGGMPGRLTFKCPLDVNQWRTPTEALSAVLFKEASSTMKDCTIRVENGPTGRVKEGRCDGSVDVPGFWVEADSAGSRR